MRAFSASAAHKGQSQGIAADAAPLCWQALHAMKLIAHLILIVFSSSIYANNCTESSSTESEAVTIKPDTDPASGMFHVRAPQKFNGMELRLLVLSATMKGSEKGNEISLPLAIKTKGELTGSYFHMPTNWLNVRLAASYGEGLCTELVAKFSM